MSNTITSFSQIYLSGTDGNKIVIGQRHNTLPFCLQFPALSVRQ